MNGIVPTSTAGILLRELGSPEKAAQYAERMAQRCTNSRSTLAVDYQDAAQQLRACISARPCTRPMER